MKITEFLKNNILVLDGGMGTLLQKKGLEPGEKGERWNTQKPEVIREIHKAYFDAGSNVVNANTFGINRLRFDKEELEPLVDAAIRIASEAANESTREGEKWVALDIGPTGRMLKPLGDLDFEDAVSIFAEIVRLGAKHGADLVFIETMSDCLETKAAVLAAKENCDLPIFVCNAYGEDGKLLTGASPLAMIAMLEGMGVDAVGVNCSLGPKVLLPVVEEYIKYSSLPVIVKPNAGLPVYENGNTVYGLDKDDFAKQTAELVSIGARVVGGCCGTTPEYISALKYATEDLSVGPIETKNYTVASSYTNGVIFGESAVLIGERINPTGKPRFREALQKGEIEYALGEAVMQEERGAQILDVNVGAPGVDEASMLANTVYEIQSVTSLPLQIDTSNYDAMERALRIYNGKAMINSVNGKAESMEKIFPLVKKYGGVVVALTLDEGGIPQKAEDRLKIARKILREAKKWGIDKKDIIFDPLAMAVSADKNAARETLLAIRLITEKLGCKTILGVSNVSFGLPKRDIINANYLALALENGLGAAIINPYSEEIMNAYHAFNALSRNDENFLKYIDYTADKDEKKVENHHADTLEAAIIKGFRELSAELTKKALSESEPLQIVNEKIIPALNKVGEDYEARKIYLPQILMSAEAAKSAFEVIKSASKKSQIKGKKKIVLATVKGDIHDIGKNIVKLILENYGFDVLDLGKDVPPEKIVSEARRISADVVGLSALMTTTLPAMEESVGLVKKAVPNCKIMVGGAVLTAEYATTIGADFYAPDAMAAVRWLTEKTSK